jgi:hypothetical protein
MCSISLAAAWFDPQTLPGVIAEIANDVAFGKPLAVCIDGAVAEHVAHAAEQGVTLDEADARRTLLAAVRGLADSLGRDSRALIEGGVG